MRVVGGCSGWELPHWQRARLWVRVGVPEGDCWGVSWRAVGELQARRGVGLLCPGSAWPGGSLGSVGLCRGPALGSIPAAGGSAPRPADSLGHSCLGLQHPQQCRTTPVLGTTLLPGLPPALPTSAQREWSPTAGAGPLPVALPRQSRSLPPPGRDGCNKEEKEERSVSPPPRRWSQDPGESQLPPAWGRQSGVAPLTAILWLLPRRLAALRRGRAAALPDHFALTKALGKAASPPPPSSSRLSSQTPKEIKGLGSQKLQDKGKKKNNPMVSEVL